MNYKCVCRIAPDTPGILKIHIFRKKEEKIFINVLQLIYIRKKVKQS